ncbi:MAG: beta-galactosidase, partial [Rhizobiaceae bacterium]|nr:beta-galactosidase [Rhizobiaceae bacterium]
MKRELGVCYYPEHWPRDIWERDAQQMVNIGLSWVRIGEFGWSRIEPVEGQYEFDWLDDAINILLNAGLKIVLGTPTATPPIWMVKKHPHMIAMDAERKPRKFGSRRHYCFSHQGYRQECRKIVTKLAKRYGSDPRISAWQTDNEYGCHDTTISYSEAARVAFQDWLANRYGQIDFLNEAWGNVFWSMEYSAFEDIDLPNLTVTEPNPSHVLAFRRFCSDQVISFNQEQTGILRAHGTAPITHNFMGRVIDFDHFKVGEDLDFSCWDSYPLG